jgi:hypothetical protein
MGGEVNCLPAGRQGIWDLEFGIWFLEFQI